MYSDEDIAEMKARLNRLKEIKTEFDCVMTMLRTKEEKARAAMVDRAPSSNIEVEPTPDLETGTFQSQGEENDVIPPSQSHPAMQRLRS